MFWLVSWLEIWWSTDLLELLGGHSFSHHVHLNIGKIGGLQILGELGNGLGV